MIKLTIEEFLAKNQKAHWINYDKVEHLIFAWREADYWDKENGVMCSYTRQEITKHIDNIYRLQKRWVNIGMTSNSTSECIITFEIGPPKPNSF